MLASCSGGGGGGGGSGNPPSRVLATGVFIDSLVEGMEYSTPTRSGVTNAAGEYEYLTGEIVTFSVGDILLGQAIGKPLATPVDLIFNATDHNHPHVINVIRLLQTLDADADPTNGIVITPAVRAAAVGLVVDVETDTVTFENNADLLTLINGFTPNTALVDTTLALQHFQQQLLNIAAPEFTSTPGVAIPDANLGFVSDMLPVNNPGGLTVSSQVRISVDITHTYQQDLIITVISPNGTPVTLWDEDGDSSDDIVGMFPVTLTPAESVKLLEGDNLNGTWELIVVDNAEEDTGTLNSWSVRP